MKSITTILITEIITETITNMDKVEIDGETADRIVVCSLKDSIRGLKDSIKVYRKDLRKDGKDSHAKLELGECIRFLDALETTYEYYVGNIK